MTPTKKRVLKALKRALVPIARMLLRSNIDCKQFIEVAKWAFVDAATAEYGIRDRKTNISRVAILTGFTRKDVKRIRANMDDGLELRHVPVTVTDRLLAGWHEDKEFLTANGKPRTLEYDGEGPTFEKLFRRYTGDLPVGAMRKELLRIGVVREQKNRKLKVNRREAFNKDDAKRLEDSLKELAYAAGAAEHRATSSDRWPIRLVASRPMRQEDVHVVKAVATKQFSNVSKRLKDLFESHEAVFGGEPSADCRVGVLQIYFEEPADGEDRFIPRLIKTRGK